MKITKKLNKKNNNSLKSKSKSKSKSKKKTLNGSQKFQKNNLYQNYSIVYHSFYPLKDYGMPKSIDLWVEFLEETMRLITNKIIPNHKSIVIHCSTGIGRTGLTFVSLYLLGLKMNNKIKNFTVDKLDKFILKSREYRNPKFVESPGQYKFLLKLFNYFKNDSESYPININDKIASERWDQLKKESDKIWVQKKFKNCLPLDRDFGVRPIYETSVKVNRKKLKTFNEISKANPYIYTHEEGEFLREKFSESNTTNCDQYINANYLPKLLNYNSPAVIGAQAPTKNSVPDFIEMLRDNRVGLIIMLTDYLENNVPKADRYLTSEYFRDPEGSKFSGTKYIKKYLLKND